MLMKCSLKSCVAAKTSVKWNRGRFCYVKTKIYVLYVVDTGGLISNKSLKLEEQGKYTDYAHN